MIVQEISKAYESKFVFLSTLFRSCHKKLTEPGTTALAQTSASISSHCASQQEIRKYKSGLYCATFTCCSSVLYLTCTARYTKRT